MPALLGRASSMNNSGSLINPEDHMDDITTAALNIFSDKSSTDADMINTLRSLNLIIHLIDSSQHSLVAKIMAFDWYLTNSDVVLEICDFAINLVSFQMYYLEPVLLSLPRRLVPRAVADSVNESEFVCSNALIVLETIFKIVPTCYKKLPRMLATCFPYISRSASELSGYVQNLLKLSESLPTIRQQILETIMDQLVKLDVHASREDVEEAQCSSSNNIDNEMEESEDLFAMVLNFLYPKHTETDMVENNEECYDENDTEETLHKTGKKLDYCLEEMFQYIIRSAETLENNVNLEELTRLYEEMLQAFDKKVLPVYACCHTQFIMFYFCSLHDKLNKHFIKWLWQKFCDPNVPSVIRESCACYMTSLAARANFVSLKYAEELLEVWAGWVEQYLITQENRKQSWSIHGTFYSLCQAILYLIAFRFKEFVSTEKTLSFLQRLNLERIIKCQLNPLKFCLPHVIENFASIARNYQLAYCYSVIDRNRRQNAYQTEIVQDSYNPLEGFFPFDPYVLRLSGKHIYGLYRQYDGLTEDSECLSRNDSKTSLDVEITGESLPRSYEKVSSLRELLTYSVSPGFKHG